MTPQKIKDLYEIRSMLRDLQNMFPYDFQITYDVCQALRHVKYAIERYETVEVNLDETEELDSYS